MDNVCWKAITNKGTLVQQFSADGKYINFTQVDKSDWICFNIFNKNNNINYGIDLINGTFIFNGVNITPAIQSGIYDIPCKPKQKFDYTKTLFWYNEMLTELNTFNSDTKCLSVFIGYKLFVDENFSLQGKSGKITMVRPMLKLNLINNIATFSTSYVFQYIDENGNKQSLQG